MQKGEKTEQNSRDRANNSNKRKQGSAWEALAAEFLKNQGYEILESNFYSRFGEIDLIARDGNYLVFVEVKYRQDAACGSPLEAVDRRKQRRISRTALYYCMKKGYGETMPCRFDVIGAQKNGTMLHIKNAFEYRK